MYSNSDTLYSLPCRIKCKSIKTELMLECYYCALVDFLIINNIIYDGTWTNDPFETSGLLLQST